jgi:hypothetical protein
MICICNLPEEVVVSIFWVEAVYPLEPVQE